MKNHLEKFLRVLLAMMLLTSMALPVIADENIPADSDIKSEAKLLNPAVVVLEPAIEFTLGEVGVYVVSLIAGGGIIASVNGDGDFKNWIEDLKQFCEDNSRDSSDSLFKGLSDIYSIKEEKKRTYVSTSFLSNANVIYNKNKGTDYCILSDDSSRRIVDECKNEYNSATAEDKKRLKIYFPTIQLGHTAQQVQFSKGMNLQEATKYMTPYWTEDKKERDVYTVNSEAAEALAKAVSANCGHGGYTKQGNESEVWDHTEGKLKHWHPGKLHKGEVIQAENPKTKYTPHILYVDAWRLQV